MNDTQLLVLIVIAVIIDVLFIITTSLGIWLANGYQFSSTTSENATKGFMISVLVLAIILPVLFFLFAFGKIKV